MDKVRIGFVGVGFMGQSAHLKNYVTLGDCEVVAIAEIRPELGQKVAARYGVPKVYRNHEELMEKEKIDGLVASQPFQRHGVLLPDLFKASVPVLTEKPLASSLQAGEQIVQALAQSKAKYYIGFHKRSDPATMYVKQEIERLKETKELGALRYVRILMPAGDWVANGISELIQTPEKPEGLAFDPAPADLDEKGYWEYGSFVNYYIHQVNLMRHLLGEDYEVTYAEKTGVLLALRSASGIAGVIEMAPYQTTTAWQESALVGFDKGYIRLDLPAPLATFRAGQVAVYKDPGGGVTPTETQPQMSWIHAFRQQAMNFVAAIRGEKTPLCGPEDALKDLRVARDYVQLRAKA
jgi:predicted dehydrogenase